ncbi:MAG: hypothetical protein EZS28_053679 [Streblomastix strix]|uniref:Uncharacterized protein n=1 Tax=Streblomastix strix TaxID=222440 RepID=A0A5J4R501_9EUKA|nr:MAG: hypothetical protein EZS28_053679 [Streblomastix strix]
MAYAYLESGEYILASIVAEQVIAARDRSSLTQALHSQKDTNGSQLVSIPSSSQQRIASYSPTAHQVQLCKVYLADALSNLAQD